MLDFCSCAKLWLATRFQLEHQQALYQQDWERVETSSLQLNGVLQALPDATLDAEFRQVLTLQERAEYAPFDV